MEKDIDWEAKRDIWIQKVEALLDEIQKWCQEKEDWKVQRKRIEKEEEYLGKYAIEELDISSPTIHIKIVPVGRNTIGGQGRVDILSYPVMNSLLLIGKEDGWDLYTESKIPWPQEWGKTTFYHIVEALTK